MQKKYITLINQLIQWYHMEPEELGDLQWYLESHLRSIALRKQELNAEQKKKKILELLDIAMQEIGTFQWEQLNEIKKILNK